MKALLALFVISCAQDPNPEPQAFPEWHPPRQASQNDTPMRQWQNWQTSFSCHKQSLEDTLIVLRNISPCSLNFDPRLKAEVRNRLVSVNTHHLPFIKIMDWICRQTGTVLVPDSEFQGLIITSPDLPLGLDAPISHSYLLRTFFANPPPHKGPQWFSNQTSLEDMSQHVTELVGHVKSAAQARQDLESRVKEKHGDQLKQHRQSLEASLQQLKNDPLLWLHHEGLNEHERQGLRQLRDQFNQLNRDDQHKLKYVDLPPHQVRALKIWEQHLDTLAPQDQNQLQHLMVQLEQSSIEEVMSQMAALYEDEPNHEAVHLWKSLHAFHETLSPENQQAFKDFATPSDDKNDDPSVSIPHISGLNAGEKNTLHFTLEYLYLCLKGALRQAQRDDHQTALHDTTFQSTLVLDRVILPEQFTDLSPEQQLDFLHESYQTYYQTLLAPVRQAATENQRLLEESFSEIKDHDAASDQAFTTWRRHNTRSARTFEDLAQSLCEPFLKNTRCRIQLSPDQRRLTATLPPEGHLKLHGLLDAFVTWSLPTKIDQAIPQTPVKATCYRQPLHLLLLRWALESGINLGLDTRVLDPHLPITLAHGSLKLEDALNALARDHDLFFVWENEEQLWITNRSGMQTHGVQDALHPVWGRQVVSFFIGPLTRSRQPSVIINKIHQSLGAPDPNRFIRLTEDDQILLIDVTPKEADRVGHTLKELIDQIPTAQRIKRAQENLRNSSAR